MPQRAVQRPRRAGRRRVCCCAEPRRRAAEHCLIRAPREVVGRHAAGAQHAVGDGADQLEGFCRGRAEGGQARVAAAQKGAAPPAGKKKQSWLVVAVVVIIIIVAASAPGGSKVSSGNNSAPFGGCPNNCGNDFSYPGEIHTQARSRTFTSEDCQSSRNNGVTYEQCKIKPGHGSTSSSRRRRRCGNSHSYALCCPISPDPKYDN